MKTILLAAASTLLITGTAFAQDMTPSAYVMAAGASDLYERTASRVVLQTSKDPKVRAFAQEMIKDHTKSTGMVKTAAMKAGLKPMPPMMTPEQQDMVSQLRGMQEPARDATFIAQQRESHQKALAVQQAYAMDGTSPPLQQAAAKIVPVVQMHIDMLMTM